MKPADLIKGARQKKGWTQKQLAEVIGVTSSAVSQLEAGKIFPSYERCLALADVLSLPLDELWTQVEKTRLETFQRRIGKTDEAARTALQTPRARAVQPAALPVSAENAKLIAHDLTADTELQAVYRNLKIALANPQMHDTVLNAIQAFAQMARGDLLQIVRRVPQALASLIFKENWQPILESELGPETEGGAEPSLASEPRALQLTSGPLKGVEVEHTAADRLVITCNCPVPEGSHLQFITETGEAFELPVVRPLDRQGRAIYDLSSVSESPAFRLVMVEGESG